MEPTSTTQTLEVEPTTLAIGAIVGGLDLRAELGEESGRELRRALAEREVLFLPSQQIDPGGQPPVRGDLRRATASRRVSPRAAASIHSWRSPRRQRRVDGDRCPALRRHLAGPSGRRHCLHAQSLRPIAGDTAWASMNALYEAFLPAMRAESGDLEAKHTSEKSLVDHVRRGHDGERRRHEQRGAFPFVRDQVMQTHPVTGKKIVFVNDLLTTALHGPSRREGRALLSRLTDLTRGPAHQGRYRWEPDTIVTWDNRSVQHYAATDYAPSRCRLQRVTVAGPSASFVALGGAG